MARKSIIIYASRTGNTEKVVNRFQEVFKKFAWECDLFKVDKSIDVKHTPIDLRPYDLVCVGSYVDKSLPSERLIELLRYNPQDAHYNEKFHREGDPPITKVIGRIRLGPESQKGIAFVTFAGDHFGYVEAEPALSLLESELGHLQILCIGKFACPGPMKFPGVDQLERPPEEFQETVPSQRPPFPPGHPPGKGYFKDIQQRPHERDLLKAQIFLEEILETFD